MNRNGQLFSFWSSKALSWIDYRVIPIILALMGVSLLIIGSHAPDIHVESLGDIFKSIWVKKQMQFFALSFGVFFFFAGFDYNKLREWAWVLYVVAIVALVGLFFTGSIARVHRWYRVPFIGLGIQPSEFAKLAVVISLSWFLEKRRERSYDWSTALISGAIVGIPFLLILKQPDLGSALVLYPITLVMFYFGGLNPVVVRLMSWFGALVLAIVAIFFLQVVSHEELRPYATKVLKEYQYDRLNPHNHHQMASLTAIAVGGLTGTGWNKSEYTGGGWLPAPTTDSVFPAFGEEFGFFGLLFLMVLFYALIYVSFQVTATAKDDFGRLLSAGISVYLAMHVLVNIGMMCGLLPITGVPLILVTYGGSSVLFTMMALGILQSIYSRRFTF